MSTDDEIEQRARELAEAAPPISDQRRQRLRALLAPRKPAKPRRAS